MPYKFTHVMTAAYLALCVVFLDVLPSKESLHASLGTHVLGKILHQLLVAAEHIHLFRRLQRWDAA